jgi:hypothetical protein
MLHDQTTGTFGTHETQSRLPILATSYSCQGAEPSLTNPSRQPTWRIVIVHSTVARVEYSTVGRVRKRPFKSLQVFAVKIVLQIVTLEPATWPVLVNRLA